MKDITMKASDSISGKLGQCYITVPIDKEGKVISTNKRYNFMQLTDVEAKVEFNVTDVPILGKSGTGHKITGWKGSGTANFHYNTSMFAKIMQYFKDTGKEMRFTMQVVNDDTSSEAGQQITTLTDCLLSGATIAKLNTGTDTLTDSVSFTFDDYSVDQGFNTLSGMVGD